MTDATGDLKSLMIQKVQQSTLPAMSKESKALVDNYDLMAADHVVKEYLERRGETKEPTGLALKKFLNEMIERGFGDNKDKHLEIFSSLFHSFILNGSSHIITGCCEKKICFSCSVKGWHENFNGSCIEYLKAENTTNTIIKLCPKCRTHLLKSEGCSSVQCPNCQANFEWDKEKKIDEIDEIVDEIDEIVDIQSALQHLRNSLTRTPAHQTP